MAINDEDTNKRAEDLFVARSLEAEAARSPVALTFADLYRFLTDPAANLSLEQQRLLFANKRLRGDYKQLKKDLARTGPRLIVPAAPLAGEDEHGLVGGVVGQSDESKRHVRLIIEFGDEASSPTSLIIEAASGEIAKLPLEPKSGEASVEINLDMTRPEDQRILRLLRDPSATRTFL